MTGASASEPGPLRPLDAVFRPRRGRAMATTMGVVAVLLCGSIALAMPSIAEGGTWNAGDRLLLVGLGAAMAGLMWRYASLRAVPGDGGITVRNLMITRTLTWSEIEEVHFPDGDPWVTLHLVDTDVVAVMAIQRADGEFGRTEARRLATLVRDRRP